MANERRRKKTPNTITISKENCLSIACYRMKKKKRSHCVPNNQRSNWQLKCFYSLAVITHAHSVQLRCVLAFFFFFTLSLYCARAGAQCNPCIQRVCTYFLFTMSWFCFIVMNVLLITSSLLVSSFNLIRTGRVSGADRCRSIEKERERESELNTRKKTVHPDPSEEFFFCNLNLIDILRVSVNPNSICWPCCCWPSPFHFSIGLISKSRSTKLLPLCVLQARRREIRFGAVAVVVVVGFVAFSLWFHLIFSLSEPIFRLSFCQYVLCYTSCRMKCGNRVPC